MSISELVANFSYDTFTEYLSEMKSNGTEITSIGSSIMSRDIPLIRLGHGRRNILYVASHHGAEWITTPCLLKFAEEYTNEYNADKVPNIAVNCKTGDDSETKIGITGKTNEKAECGKTTDDFTVWCVPLLNPDGVELELFGIEKSGILAERQLKMNGGSTDFSKWQANARGVDLNHNYDCCFYEYKYIERERGITNGPTKFSGEYPESEPEVYALCSFIRSAGIESIITLHTQGEEIYYTSGGMYAPSSVEIARKLAYATGYELSQATDTAAYGGLTDFAIRSLGIPSFTLECGRGENPLPREMFDSIYDRVRPALFGMPEFMKK